MDYSGDQYIQKLFQCSVIDVILFYRFKTFIVESSFNDQGRKIPSPPKFPGYGSFLVTGFNIKIVKYDWQTVEPFATNSAPATFCPWCYIHESTFKNHFSLYGTILTVSPGD